MPRYFFHLADGEHTAIDEDGKELDSLYEAHLHALRLFEIPMLKATSEIEGPRTGLQGSRMLVLTSDPALQRRLNASLQHSGVTFDETPGPALGAELHTPLGRVTLTSPSDPMP